MGSKIAFLFHHNKADTWSTPLAIVREFESRGWDTTIYSTTGFNQEELLDSKPDVIMHMDFGMYQDSFLAKLKSSGAYCIMESGDDPQRFQLNAQKAHYFDLILSPDIRCAREYKKHGLNAEWWTHFADTRLYRPIDDVPIKFRAGCSRGINNGAYLIDKLALQDNTVANMGGWHGEEHNTFMNSCGIILQQSRYGEITRRLFEGMACRKLVLADRPALGTEVDSIFTENVHIVYYNDYEDLKSKIQPNETIANNGYELVLANHTQVQRVDFILERL